MHAKQGALKCEACKRDDISRDNTKKTAEAGQITADQAEKILGRPSLRELRGCCRKPLQQEYFWDDEDGGGPLEKCPVTMLRECEWWREFYEAWDFWKEGHYPEDGGWADQCGKFIQATKIFDFEIAQWREHLSR